MDPRAALRMWLDRGIPDSQNPTDTIRFCQEGQRLVIDHIATMLIRANPSEAAVIQANASKILEDTTGFDQGIFATQPCTAGDDGTICFTREETVSGKFHGLIAATADVDPRLPRMTYGVALFPPKKGAPQRRDYYAFRALWERYEGLCTNQGGTPRDSELTPVTDTVATLLLQQLAKSMAVDMVREVAENKLKTEAYAGNVNQEKIFTQLQEWKQRADYHLGYIKLTRDVLSDIAKTHDLTPEELQLIGDLTFFSSTEGSQYKVQPDDFKFLLASLFAQMQSPHGLFQRRDWRGALACRDFLLTYFPEIFPDWRAKGKQHFGFRGLRDVAEAMIRGEVELSAATTPPDIHNQILHLVGETHETVLERVQREQYLHHIKLGSELILAAIIDAVNPPRFRQDQPISQGNRLIVERYHYEISGYVLNTKRGAEGAQCILDKRITDYALNKKMDTHVSLAQVFAHVLYTDPYKKPEEQTWKSQDEIIITVRQNFRAMQEQGRIAPDVTLRDILEAATARYMTLQRELQEDDFVHVVRVDRLNRFIADATRQSIEK